MSAYEIHLRRFSNYLCREHLHLFHGTPNCFATRLRSCAELRRVKSKVRSLPLRKTAGGTVGKYVNEIEVPGSNCQCSLGTQLSFNYFFSGLQVAFCVVRPFFFFPKRIPRRNY